MQLSVQVDDASAAIIPVIQLRPHPASVPCLALRAQIVSTHIDLPAGLGISAGGNCTASAPRTLEPAFIIHNVANAAIGVFQSGIEPASIAGFAAGAQPVALDLNITASLAIGTARAAATPVTVTVAIAITVAIAVSVPSAAIIIAAPELAIKISDAAIALAEVVERGINPLAASGLATRPQRVVTHAHVAAGLQIGALRRGRVLVARKLSFNVRDVAHAAVSTVKGRIDPAALAGLALGLQPVVVVYLDIAAGGLIAARRNVLGGAGKSHGKSEDSQHKGMAHRYVLLIYESIGPNVPGLSMLRVSLPSLPKPAQVL